MQMISISFTNLSRFVIFKICIGNFLYQPQSLQGFSLIFAFVGIYSVKTFHSTQLTLNMEIGKDDGKL